MTYGAPRFSILEGGHANLGHNQSIQNVPGSNAMSAVPVGIGANAPASGIGRRLDQVQVRIRRMKLAK